MPNPVAIPVKGKGFQGLIKRAPSIGKRYGVTASKMDRALDLFVRILKNHNCGASFPITASALARNRSCIKKYVTQNIEFSIHGLFHVDYSQLSLAEQNGHLERARKIFRQNGIQLTGFRCPYLRWNDDTLTAVANNDLSYDASQALYWDVVDGYVTKEYERVLGFYRARSARDYPALPKVVGEVVQIPYCVPDDEALIERLGLSEIPAMSEIWLDISERTYELGELFTLGLHPERIGLLQQPLTVILTWARSLSPKVWVARLDEITHWWLARNQATFEVVGKGDNVFHLTIQGPPGISILVRDVEIEARVDSKVEGFDRVLENSFRFRARELPCIGVSPDCDPALLDFLGQQGYWAETARGDQVYSVYLDQPRFAPEDERPLLRLLAGSDASLIRLGRWPNGASSALCITGDIDALTLWDYGLRLFGR